MWTVLYKTAHHWLFIKGYTCKQQHSDQKQIILSIQEILPQAFPFSKLFVTGLTPTYVLFDFCHILWTVLSDSLHPALFVKFSWLLHDHLKICFWRKFQWWSNLLSFFFLSSHLWRTYLFYVEHEFVCRNDSQNIVPQLLSSTCCY